MEASKESFGCKNETAHLLLGNKVGKPPWIKGARRIRRGSICIRSKAAWLTLIWCCCIGITYGLVSNPSNGVFQLIGVFIVALYVVNSIFLCFYPLAGYLADNVVGKYKMIIRSLQVLLIALLVSTVPTAIFIALIFTVQFVGLVGIIVVAVLFYLAMNISFIGFNANVIQFGMEQLHDSPVHYQSLFIYWYVWIYYLVQLIIVQPWNMLFTNDSSVAIPLCGSLLLLASFAINAVSLCVALKRKKWFLIIPSEVSPYKLVYKVTQFARHHKVPIRRSAFTYCEDEIPTGLDLAKNKYGGPFTTEEVENVKAFYGILKIIVALGPVFFFTYAVDPAMFCYIQSFQWDYSSDYNLEENRYHYFFGDNTLSSAIVVILIPLCLAIKNMYNCPHYPNMLKRIGLGIIFLIMALVSIAALISPLLSFEKPDCTVFPLFYENKDNSTADSSSAAIMYLLPILPRCLYGVSNMLLYTALYEFICAQSPSSMKGLLIGLSFSVKGVFQALGAAFAIPLYLHQFRGYDLLYYGINIALALVTLAIFSYFARRYQYRERDDICDVYRYAEEYYSNSQEEKHYD